jgi:hypothetical protein
MTGYTPPGVTIEEVVVPNAAGVTGVPLQIGVIGVADRTRTVTNLQLQRGLVEDETLTLVAPTGTGDSLTFAGGLVTLLDAGAVFGATRVGAQISISGATNPANNGTFTIVEVVSATSVIFANAAGVTETSAFTWQVVPNAVLVNRGNRRLQDSDYLRNGAPIPDQYLRYVPGIIIGNAAGPYNLQLAVESGAGAGSVSAPVSQVQTLTDAGASFTAALVGALVVVSGSATPGNNGTFRITSVPSATTLTYVNAAGAADAGAGFTYSVNGTALALTIDGIAPVTLRLQHTSGTGVAAGTVQILGREIRVATTYGTPTAATRGEIATAINTALAGASSLGFGAAYSAFAYAATAGLILRSPSTTPTSDIEVGTAIANDGAVLLLGAAGADNRLARTVIQVARSVYSTTAVYLASYVSVSTDSDATGFTGVTELSSVGSQPSADNFTVGVDCLLSGNSIAWGGPSAPPDTPAVFAGAVLGSSTVDVSVNNTFSMTINGTTVSVQVSALASPPLNYRTFTPATASLADIVANINAVLAAQLGPSFRAVASVPSGVNQIVLTSPTEGESASITVSASATATALFGALVLPLTVTGAGRRPTVASVYYATFTITRPANEYNAQKRFFSVEAARADLGPTSASNTLMLAVEIAFLQRPPSVVVVQVDDTSLPGSPTRAEFAAAMNATLKTDVITDLVVLSTSLAVQTDFRALLETANSSTTKRYRRGWFGMARSTPVGSRDDAGSYVYMATRTLAFAPTSPARGRAILVAPPQLTGVSYSYVDGVSGESIPVNLDSTYLAVAWAALRSSLTNPALSLARRTVAGFNLDDINDALVWTQTESNLLASQGTFVTSFDAGLFRVLDPVTTEAGGAGAPAFKYESTSTQKDNITRKVELALDASLVGIVPVSPADFLLDIKIVIASVLNAEISSGTIGPYTDRNGVTRALNISEDIQTSRDPNDPTQFLFDYWYNLRYPALRLSGRYSVDNPFFQG